MRFLHHHEVGTVGDPAGVELQFRRVPPPPFAEVLHAFETFAGLGKLEHGVVAVDLVGDVFVLA
ncbi:hypothetical protein [Arthrobacter sp. D3-16]